MDDPFDTRGPIRALCIGPCAAHRAKMVSPTPRRAEGRIIVEKLIRALHISLLSIAVLLGAAVALFLVGYLKPTPALAQTTTAAATAPSCSTASFGVNASIFGTFACVADLDGTGKKQIVIGYEGGSSGHAVILTNTGAVRQTVCWNASGICPVSFSSN